MVLLSMTSFEWLVLIVLCNVLCIYKKYTECDVYILSIYTDDAQH